MSLWERATAPLRRLRWRRAGWSTSSDQAFHDRLFAVEYDPFTPSYPGYLSIRRFADLAAERIGGARHVVDLGCGPGEITCELARRLPGAAIVGVDHSHVAVGRASEHARRLGLTNVSFIAANLESFAPGTQVDAVLMFDAFHHLIDPEAFVARWRPMTRRFVLIEPAGNWYGSWNRDHDVDWLPASLLRMRERLEHQLGVLPVQTAVGNANDAWAHEEPTERRYAAADFASMFAPWNVELTGTIAGLQEYDIRPFSRSEIRDRVGELTYELVAGFEKLLRDFDADLNAKHWVVHAAPDITPRLSGTRRLTEMAAPLPVQPSYDAHYSDYRGPRQGAVGQTFTASVTVENRGWQEWTPAGESPVNASYHWLDGEGHTAVADGIRTPLAGAVEAGGKRDIALKVQCPAKLGTYTLAIDLVREGVTWFSEAGAPPLRVPFEVR